jgi:mannosylglycerate hydrolase
MLANRGLPEYEALREPDGSITIALTLLRCVGWLSKGSIRTRKVQAGPTMETPGAQMPGRWTFAYSIIPHEGGWHEAYSEAHRFVRPLRAVRTSRGNGSLPPAGSLIDIRPPDAILSTLKLAEDGEGVVARVYNISDEPISGRIRLPNAGGAVHRTNLNEEDPTSVDLVDDAIPLSLNRNEIATFKYTTNPPENEG